MHTDAYEDSGQSNMAMGNGSFTDEFLIQTFIYRELSHKHIIHLSGTSLIFPHVLMMFPVVQGIS